MRLVKGDEPTPLAVVTSEVIPPPTVTPAPEVSCPEEARSIVIAANSQGIPLSRFPSVDSSSGDDIPLVKYEVNGDQLSAPELLRAPDNLLPYQRDFKTQRSAWQLFTTLVPADQRTQVEHFEVMTDGPGGVLSAVEQTGDSPTSWELVIDIADTYDTKNLAFTRLHEFGHLLTLGPAQVPPDLRVFNDPNSKRTRERVASECASYFPGEGCSLPASYVNSFYSSFWKGLYDEWNAIDQLDDYDRREAKLRAFYHKYRDQFVDSYAVTSPVEDIAESWAFFVLSPRPGITGIRDEKLEFFYSYPELVQLRERILSGLCAANP
jgi:hypothetical protein